MKGTDSSYTLNGCETKSKENNVENLLCNDCVIQRRVCKASSGCAPHCPSAIANNVCKLAKLKLS